MRPPQLTFSSLAATIICDVLKNAFASITFINASFENHIVSETRTNRANEESKRQLTAARISATAFRQ